MSESRLDEPRWEVGIIIGIVFSQNELTFYAANIPFDARIEYVQKKFGPSQFKGSKVPKCRQKHINSTNTKL